MMLTTYQPFRGDSLLTVDVGPLSTIRSFCFHAGPRLIKFNDLFRLHGGKAEIEWDLSGALPRQVSLVALATFVATAHRLWKLTGRAQKVRWPRNAELQRFLGTTLQKLFVETNLFETQLRGAVDDETAAVSRIFIIERPQEGLTEETSVEDAKKYYRGKLTSPFLKLFGSLFGDLSELVSELALTCAELVTNCVLWGQSPAVLGVQRNRSGGITIAICDSGQGFIHSLRQNRRQWQLDNNAEALILGSVINLEGPGIRRVTEKVTLEGGWVVVSTLDTAVIWSRDRWLLIRDSFDRRDVNEYSVASLVNDAEVQVFPAVRGSRISFELPPNASLSLR